MPGIAEITQLSPTSQSVISLGHTANVPLIGPSSELGYRFEPHDHIYSAVPRRGSAVASPGYGVGGRGVPGVCGSWVGAGRGIPDHGTQPARLRLIYGI